MAQLILPFEKTEGRPSVRLGERQLSARRIRARFDSAETNDNNRRHWAYADGLSADASSTAEIRRILRNRARYEVANNSYARGIVLTLANDTVGTGPRLQMLTPDNDLNRRIEQEFQLWSQAVRLAEKLRTLRMARAQDGEAFGLMVRNPVVDHPVGLDLRLIEADQVTAPWGTRGGIVDETDGIYLDDFGNPVAYSVLPAHPGGTRLLTKADAEMMPAWAVVHYFRPERPGQHRGVPEITSALPLFAQLRRFTLAVIGAAEAAANFSGILYTDAPANGEADEVEPLDRIELHRNMLLTMPGGWKMDQVDPKQPATTYAEFKKEILNEIARCLNMPFNVAAGNSSGYNYASGRLDHQTYYKSIRVEQSALGINVLDPLLKTWLALFSAPRGTRLLEYRPSGLVALPPHMWFWDGMEHVDPVKEATAQEIRLRNHLTTLSIECARQGLDYEEVQRQRGKEIALQEELRLPGVARNKESKTNDDETEDA